jgi:hypothetical protein
MTETQCAVCEIEIKFYTFFQINLSLNNYLPDFWLSKHPDGPVNGHLDMCLQGFSSVFKQMLRWFTSYKLLLPASHTALLI